jgi:hypothetical protein
MLADVLGKYFKSMLFLVFVSDIYAPHTAHVAATNYLAAGLGNVFVVSRKLEGYKCTRDNHDVDDDIAAVDQQMREMGLKPCVDMFICDQMCGPNRTNDTSTTKILRPVMYFTMRLIPHSLEAFAMAFDRKVMMCWSEFSKKDVPDMVRSVGCPGATVQHGGQANRRHFFYCNLPNTDFSCLRNERFSDVKFGTSGGRKQAIFNWPKNQSTGNDRYGSTGESNAAMVNPELSAGVFAILFVRLGFMQPLYNLADDAGVALFCAAVQRRYCSMADICIGSCCPLTKSPRDDFYNEELNGTICMPDDIPFVRSQYLCQPCEFSTRVGHVVHRDGMERNYDRLCGRYRHPDDAKGQKRSAKRAEKSAKARLTASNSTVPEARAVYEQCLAEQEAAKAAVNATIR